MTRQSWYSTFRIESVDEREKRFGSSRMRERYEEEAERQLRKNNNNNRQGYRDAGRPELDKNIGNRQKIHHRQFP
jgi:hypothetical protein